MFAHVSCPPLTYFPITPFFNILPSPNSTVNFRYSQSLRSPEIRASRGLSMEDLNKSDAFYLVRKGDMIGIYKSLADCRAQAGSSVCDPSISVFKGYGMSKEAEEFLRSHGLKNASYSIDINGAKENLAGKFGTLIPCPYQKPASVDEDSSPERWEEAAKLIEIAERTGFSSLRTAPQKKVVKPDSSTSSLGTRTVSSSHESPVGRSVATISQTNSLKSDGFMNFVGTPTVSSRCDTCIIEFDGASKGNPGKAGAGVLLRAADGSSVWRLREGVGLATNNVAEYRALLLGMKHALTKGFKHIVAKGDSNLVVMQVQGKWKTKNPNMAALCTEAKKLIAKFVSFQISHVLRVSSFKVIQEICLSQEAKASLLSSDPEFNSEADSQANRAVNLMDGQVEEDYQKL